MSRPRTAVLQQRADVVHAQPAGEEGGGRGARVVRRGSSKEGAENALRPYLSPLVLLRPHVSGRCLTPMRRAASCSKRGGVESGHRGVATRPCHVVRGAFHCQAARAYLGQVILCCHRHEQSPEGQQDEAHLGWGRSRLLDQRTCCIFQVRCVSPHHSVPQCLTTMSST